jgi:hypothetical protein
MNRLNVEYLLGHSIGLNSSYYRPTQQELLTDYQKAIPSLSFTDPEVTNLREQQHVLEHKYQENEKKYQEKDREIEEMKRKMDVMYKAFEASGLVSQFQEEQKKAVIHSNSMQKVVKEIRAEEEEEEVQEQEAAAIVDAEIETEFSSHGNNKS